MTDAEMVRNALDDFMPCFASEESSRRKRETLDAFDFIVARVEELESSEDRLMSERDATEKMANDLANAIAAHFGQEIGEHSNCNCPWQNALEIIENAPSSL